MSIAPHQTPDQEAARRLRAESAGRFTGGDLEGALRLLTQAVELDPSSAEGHYLLGNCLRRLRRTEGAEAAFKAALAQDPGLTAASFGLAFLYEETGSRQESAAQLRRLSSQPGADLDLLHKVGGVMGEFRFYADAAALYESILKREPQARNHLRLGQYYQKLGRYPEAIRALTAAIDLNPDAGAAYLLLASSRRFNQSADDQTLLTRFTRALETGTPSRMTRICLNFALGKIHDDLDGYDKAFGYFAEGNRLRREELHPFAPQEWMDIARQLEELDASLVAPLTSAKPGPAPMFVVGMLRSGTTLVERILASHPQVVGLGETAWLDNAVGRAVQETGAPYPACLVHMTEALAADLRQDYLRHWPREHEGARYFVDKNPLNFTYLGLITRVFPEAKIVHCRRDPRDAGLSVYFQNFANRDNNYAYDLIDIANFHNGYARMMAHWEKVLPAGAMHALRYEDLVGDQEKQTRALLAALALPWDAACLEFDKQPDDISTASVWQARQPLYKQSVGRWRHYERHLAPLIKTLAL